MYQARKDGTLLGSGLSHCETSVSSLVDQTSRTWGVNLRVYVFDRLTICAAYVSELNIESYLLGVAIPET